MICYLDASAMVKLYVWEKDSAMVRDLVDTASVVATSKVAYPEARAALARGFREGIIGEEDYRRVVTALQCDWPRYLAVQVSDPLVRLAGELAERHRFRGFDSIHLASAVTLRRLVKSQVKAACYDARLWQAFIDMGFEVVPEERP